MAYKKMRERIKTDSGYVDVSRRTMSDTVVTGTNDDESDVTLDEMLGDTDISSIGESAEGEKDGTITSAISKLNSDLSDLGKISYDADAERLTIPLNYAHYNADTESLTISTI